jgi:hypothetical protein
LLPGLSGGLTWNVLYGTSSAALFVGPASGIGNTIPGDFNQNGTIDAADYTVWRDTLGQTQGVIPGIGADGSFDGQISAADHAIWRSMFGFQPNTGGGQGNFATVPEPTSALLMMAATALVGSLSGTWRRRRSSSVNCRVA